LSAYEGACHCGAIRTTFRSAKGPAELGARTCQCSFCRAHGASWISDPLGSLEVRIGGPINRYRFGTGTADFLICSSCGVVPAVLAEMESGLHGVVRADCLDKRDAFLAAAAPSDYEGEAIEARLDRRAGRWTPARILEAVL
jgi:hypothetical protein